MKIISVALSLLLASSCLGQSYWKSTTIDNSPGEAIISYADVGHDTITSSIYAFPTEQPSAILKHLWLGTHLTENSQFENEIQDFYEKEASLELDKAKASSGNINNPAIIPLRSRFAEAVASTTFAQDVEDALLHIGYKIDGISFEKLMLKEGKFNAMVWILTRKTEQGAAANP